MTVWTLGLEVKVYKLHTHSYFWRGDESIHRRGERPKCRRASFLFYPWPSNLCFGPETIHQMIEFPTNRGNAALLGDFWWHCWTWKPTVMQSRGNLWGKLLIQVSSETFKEKKKTWCCNNDQRGNQIILFQIALGFISLAPLPLSPFPPFFLLSCPSVEIAVFIKHEATEGKN